MLKRFKLVLMLFLFSFALSGCIKEKVEIPTKPSIDITTPSDGDNSTPSTTPSENTEDIEFKVSLIANNKIYKPKRGEKIIVIWDNLNGESHTAEIDKDGYARCKNLDGDFLVHLASLPDKYTYNPNNPANMVNRSNPELEIELKRLLPLKGNGSGLYRPDVYQMSTEGYYRCEAMGVGEVAYYEFFPKESGTYVFESLVDAYTNEVNPIAYLYVGQSTAKFFDKVVNTGGFSQGDGYTQNFKMEFSVSDNMKGNVFTFGILCESKTDVYPQNVDFLIINKEDYEDVNPIVGLKQTAKELDKAKIPSDFNTKGKTLKNADGGFGNYYNIIKEDATLLDGSYFKYKEDEGIYYYYDPKTQQYITPLCAYITSPNPYTDLGGSLSTIQDAGNKSLTVRTPDGDHLDYSYFIEVQYAEIANENGLVFVTKELKDFLQMLSNSQRYFMDGNGYIEDQYHVMSNGEDQWLFDCCYYV